MAIERGEVESITRDQWLEMVSYDPDSGEFTWVMNERRAKRGHLAGAVNGMGYLYITVRGVKVRANRLAWFLLHGEWPALHVDHINGDPLDNRASNLRLATNAQNTFNGKTYSNNRLGIKGIVKRSDSGRYRAYINCNGRIDLGTFDSLEAAVAARLAGEIKYHGEFAASQSRLVPADGGE